MNLFRIRHISLKIVKMKNLTIEELRKAFLCGVAYADSHPKDTDEGLGDEEIDYQLYNWNIIKKE